VHTPGESCDYHDAAVALLRDGVRVAAAAEERFSRMLLTRSPGAKWMLRWWRIS
jgi:predicted NodU family carbamoyl transferase